MTFRKSIFWVHLCSGIIAGAVIAIMSITGIAIAFEEEILAWIDRDISRIEVPAENPKPLPIAELKAAIDREMPEFQADYLRVASDPERAYQFLANWEGPAYINPYTAEVQYTQTEAAHHFLHELIIWHRFLGMDGEETWLIGRYINGICNIAFLVLCLTGLYLWFPRKWSWRALRPILWFKRKYKGKARDFNWHNVFGFWSLPVLAILAATAVVISFEWGHKLVFTVFGEQAPEHRDFRMTYVEPVMVPTPNENTQPVSIDTILRNVQEAYPDNVFVGLNFDPPENANAPVNVAVTLPDYMPNRAYVPVELDPYTGEILRAIRLEDRSPGLQARLWIRFLHTGAAFGVTGKIIASIATAASLFLVYTGFALSYRRFFRKKRRV